MKAQWMTGMAGLAVLVMSGTVAAQQTVFAHAEIGMTSLHENNTPVDESSDALVSSDVDEDVWYGRFAAQVPWHKGAAEFGWEAGAGLGWTSPDVAYAVRVDGGTTARIAVKSDLVILQTFMGLYGALNFGPHVRLSASAGPAFVYGSQSSDPVEETVMVGGQPVTVKVGGNDTDATVVGYAHANLHVEVSKGVWVGAGAGMMSGDLDFSNTIGEIPLDRAVFSLSFGAPMDI